MGGVVYAQNNGNNGNGSTNNGQGSTQWKTNGNIADSNNYFGTKNEYPVKFRAGDIEQMRITPQGNIGIGTSNPQAKLDVKGNVFISNGQLYLPYLKDSTLENYELILIDSTGALKRAGDLKSLVYGELNKPCKDGNDGYTTPAAPTWANGSGILYTTNQCIPNVKVGIGTNTPQAKLHIKLNDSNFDTHAFIIEKNDGSKILQLNENGVLQAREIKVDLNSWPDYVFDPNYTLMSLEEVKQYIIENNHLPNVASACEIEENGINVSETSVMLMEKVEELTLYLIQLQEQMKKQEELLKTQQILIETLQESVKN
jgi:hypothetical protein